MEQAYYTARLDECGLVVFNLIEHMTPYEQSVTLTWQISINRIRMKSASQMLDMCAYFAPDRIPLSLFREYAKQLPKPLGSDMRNEIEAERIAEELTRYSLMKRDGREMLSMHRLLQEAIRNMQGNDRVPIYTCLKLVQSINTGETADYVNLSYALPHLFEVLRHAMPLIKRKRKWRKRDITYLYYIAHLLETHNYVSLALDCLLIIHAECPAVFGTSHSVYFDICYSIAKAYLNTGNLVKAREWYVSTIHQQTTASTVSAENVPQLIEAHEGLTTLYAESKNYDLSVFWYERAQEIRKQFRSVCNPPKSKGVITDAAFSYKMLGDEQKLMELITNERKQMAKNPATDLEGMMGEYCCLAFFNELTGQFQDALDDYEKALCDGENLQVKEHPTVIALQLLCASRYRLFGDYEKEMGLYEKVLPVQIKTLGGDHPDIKRTKALMKRCQRELA